MDQVTSLVLDDVAVVQYIRDRDLDTIADQAAASLNQKESCSM